MTELPCYIPKMLGGGGPQTLLVSLLDIIVWGICIPDCFNEHCNKTTHILIPNLQISPVDSFCRIMPLVLSFPLCTSDDIQVRFYEEKDEDIVWEAYAEFSQSDVHRQVLCS